jgi:thymidine kinase
VLYDANVVGWTLISSTVDNLLMDIVKYNLFFKYTISFQVIFGPMFSGKTTELIRRLKRYQIAKYKCLILKYANDDRYSASDIVSHDHQSLVAISARQIMDIRFKALEYDVVGIDEGQFVSSMFLFLHGIYI